MYAYSEEQYDGLQLTLDFETTNQYKGNPSYGNRVVCAVWYVDGKLNVATSNFSKLAEDIERADVLVAHNAKFELKWLYTLGIDTTHLSIFDTLLAEYAIQGNGGELLALGPVCKRYGLPTKEPYIDKLMKNGVCPSEMPESFLISRCKDDVLTTHALSKKIRERLTELNLWPCYHTKALFCRVLADMELRGMHLDKDRVLAAYREANNMLLEVEGRLAEFTGGINHNSPKQKAEYLYDVLGFKELKDRRGEPLRTSAGGRKTDRDTILALKPETEEQEQYLSLLKEHSNLYADVSKALEKFRNCVLEDELLIADFNQARSNTHRLTSSGTKHKVQFQNLHRKFKPLFNPRNEGWLMAEVDGSQLEFRVAGYLGDDDAIREAIDSGVDVHSVTRDIINRAGGNVDRTGAKAHTFKPLYGGESGTPSEVAYYQEFRRLYPGISNTQEKWCEEVINNGFIRMPTGLVFRWPDRMVNSRGRLNVRTSVCNYPVQYLATGEIIPIAVVFLWHRMREHNMQSFLVNTVHDSAIAEIHPEEGELFTKLAVQSFTTDVYNYLFDNYGIQFDVTLGVEVKMGDHWSEGEELKYEVKWND